MSVHATEQPPPSVRRTGTATAPWLYAVGVIGPLAAVAAATLVFGVEPSRLLRDPNAYSVQAFYVGFFSNIGVLAWWTAAVSCLTAAAAMHPRGRDAGWAAVAVGGTLSAVLGLDDLLMIHEAFVPDYLGLPELLPLAAYAAAMAWYLWRFRAFHLSMDTGLLAAALVLLGLSVAADLAYSDAYDGLPVLLEDGSKFGGICAWAAYHAAAACRFLRGGAVGGARRFGGPPSQRPL